MIRKCPKNCSHSPSISKYGSYIRSSDSKKIQRWICNNCKTTLSQATDSLCFKQKKRRLNPVIERLINAKASKRRIAHLLKINRKTVDRKVKFLGIKHKKSRFKFLENYKINKASKVQFDDLVTFEHTKLKPVAISLMVEESTRKILDYEVSQMAANGRLASLSRKKYGRRKARRRFQFSKR